jgi:hypothetical protein
MKRGECPAEGPGKHRLRYRADDVSVVPTCAALSCDIVVTDLVTAFGCSAVPSRTCRGSSLRSPCYGATPTGRMANSRETRNRPTTLTFDQANVIFGAFRGDVDGLDQAIARHCPDVPLTGDHVAGWGAGT